MLDAWSGCMALWPDGLADTVQLAAGSGLSIWQLLCCCHTICPSVKLLHKDIACCMKVR